MVKDLTKSPDSQFDFDVKHEMERTGLGRSEVFDLGYFAMKRKPKRTRKQKLDRFEKFFKKMEGKK